MTPTFLVPAILLGNMCERGTDSTFISRGAHSATRSTACCRTHGIRRQSHSAVLMEHKLDAPWSEDGLVFTTPLESLIDPTNLRS